MGLFEIKAADVTPPIAGDVIAITVTTSSASTAIPAGWTNEWITIKAEGGPCYYLFGTAVGVTVDETAASGATCGDFISENERIPFYLDKDRNLTHIAVKKTASATVKLRVSRS